MYTNENGNGNGNGHKRIRLSLSDLKNVATLDPAPISNGDNHAKASEKSVGTSQKDETPNAAHEAKRTAQAKIVEANGEESDENLELIENEERRKRLKRVFVSFGIISCALVMLFVVGYLWLFAGTGETHRVENQQGRERANGATSANAAPQGLTVDEIRREMNRGSANPSVDGNGEPSSSNTNANASGSPITDRLPLPDYSATVAPSPQLTPQQQSQQGMSNSPTSTQTIESNEASTNGRASRGVAGQTATGSPNPERSIRVSALNVARADTAERSMQPAQANINSNDTASTNRASEQVALPPLGTMLPVRTLGTIYTLRSEGYVRMQLVRAAGGRGWSLPRGTEVYGVVRGSDFEIGRAYVQLIGFLDQGTGRLVRLQGSVVGGDGAEGLRGQKRNLQSGWTRALRIAGAGAVEALSTVAATIGRRPVYAGDIYGYGAPRVTSPLMGEINGIAYRQGRAGFVEIPAGTNGYVLVMTSPREIQGVDADVSIENLRRSSDAASERDAARISENELAELMTNGSREDIRNALPRMTPEMRRIAEAALAGQ